MAAKAEELAQMPSLKERKKMAGRKHGSVAQSGHAVERFGIIQIKDAALFRGCVLADLLCVRPDDASGAHLRRSAFQFLVNLGGKNDGVAASALEDREDHGSLGGIELLDQSIHQAFADERMVDQA